MPGYSQLFLRNNQLSSSNQNMSCAHNRCSALEHCPAAAELACSTHRMLCEKCQKEKALVHLTEKDGPSADESTLTTRRHFCNHCADEYSNESQRYLKEHSPELKQAMSKQERLALIQRFREEMRRHMTEWALRGRT
jgi:anti-sigma factor ChrR (cupin superfamily)